MDTSADSTPRNFGAFLGVFTPSILTILGVIMYLRFGWVVGNEGLLKTIFIVVIANSITLITALSVSATVTNMQVGVGGAYYIISRSLGLEIGGAIGLPLYLSQVFSITLYSLGLAESFRFIRPDVPIMPVAAAIIVIIMVISLVSASLALKLQIPIMIMIFLSLASLVLGARFDIPADKIMRSFPDSPGFWAVFAVFFPAVTGILAGVSMSGNLKRPKRDIPLGAMGAVLTGFAVYMIVPVILAFSASRDLLLTDSLVWARIARWPLLVLPGLWGAIFSSAVGSTLSAPRTLQALSLDRIMPGVFRIASKKSGEPYLAIIVSSCIALAALMIGDLNAVAPILTIFFLTTYGMVNLVAGLESLVGDPSYRPAIKIPWFVSLLGAVSCFSVMALISKKALVIAIILEFGIWFLLRRRSMQTTWGDVRRGIWLSLARFSLLNLSVIEEKPRGWRPNILVFSGNAKKRLDLIRFATWFGQNKGLVTVCDVLVGQVEETIEKVQSMRDTMCQFLESRGVIAFCQVGVVQEFESGVLDIIQSSGMAGMESNTIMFGWSRHIDRLASYLKIMRQAGHLRKSVIICRIKPKHYFNTRKTIDIWWGGQQRNGDIMLLMAYLLSMNSEWASSVITLKSIARSPEEQESISTQLDLMIPEIRIKCSREVFLKPPDINIHEFIHQESGNTDIVFLGLAQPAPGDEMNYARQLSSLVEGLGTVVLLKNSSMFIGDLIS
ncbi:Na-K-Cl cotransporter [bacterium]|nr:Na-K-Cl cotransporter [candidate division CSSED10-310 bacterium]